MADKKAKEAKKDDSHADDTTLAAKKDDSAEEGAEGTEEVSAKGSNKKKIIIIAAALILLLAGGGAGAYFMGYLDSFLPGHKVDCSQVKEGDKDYASCAEAAAKDAAGADPSGTFIDIPDLVVNLNSLSKQPHFLKISLKVELEKKEDEKLFSEVLPRVIDQFQAYLRELRLEDLRGSSGLYRMKLELLTRVKAAAPGIKVRDVLFQEILVQ
jgi:flagellar FliL protein